MGVAVMEVWCHRRLMVANADVHVCHDADVVDACVVIFAAIAARMMAAAADDA